MRDELERHRQHRHHDDADGHQREIVLDDRHVAEEPAGAQAQRDPGDRSHGVVEDERPRRHLRRPCDERHERADDRNETGEHDGFRAVFFIEGVRTFQVIPKLFVALNERLAGAPPDKVTGLISDNGGSRRK